MRQQSSFRFSVLLCALAIVLALVFLLAACSRGTGSGSGAPAPSTKGVDTAQLPAWLLDSFTAPPPVEEPVTARARIEAAYEAEEIDVNEYFRLRLREAFSDEELPAAYSGERVPAMDNGFILYMLRERFDELDAATREELRPYLLSDDDPESFWHTGAEYTTLDDTVAPSASADLALTLYDWFTFIPAVGAVQHTNEENQAFVITFEGANQQKAFWVRDAAIFSHDKYKAVGFPEPEEWILIRLVPEIPGGYLGLARMAVIDGEDRCLIHIKSGQERKMLEAATAHEMFHCFQYHYDLPPYAVEEWIYESTAVWAQEFVYPTTNTEHEFDEVFFPHLDDQFFDHTAARHYADYLWWFYLSQKAGKSHAPIKEMLEAAQKPNGQKRAFQARPNFREELMEYAIWNVNEEPYKRYQDVDGEPRGTPSGTAVERATISADEEFSQSVDLEPGSMKYYQYLVQDDVQRLRFDLSGVNTAVNPYAGIQAFVIVDGASRLFDVSHQEELVFCRNRPEERVDAVILVFTHANLNVQASRQVLVDTTGECARSWHGTLAIRWTETVSDTQETFSGDAAHRSYEERGVITSHDTLVYDPEWDQFLLAEQQFSYDYSENYHVTYDRDCGLLSESETAWERGGGHGTFDIDEENVEYSDAPARLSGIEGSPGTYALELGIVSGTGMAHSESQTVRTPCALEGVFAPGMGEGSEQVFDNEYDASAFNSIINWPHIDLVVTMSPDQKRLTGSGEAWFPSDGRRVPVEIDVEYTYG